MGRPPRVTREQILDTARRVFVAKGYESATLADIAAELGVTPAAVLRHAGSKHELFVSAIRGGEIRVPDFIAALETIDASTDPRAVLREIAERFIPFAQTTIAQNLAVYMHNRAQTSFVLPFDTESDDTPPRRGLRVVTSYFRRAAAAGVLRIRDPRAAALLFMGSLQSYVFLHQVLHVAARPYPLAAYIDQLIDVWTKGAIVVGGRRGRKKIEPAEASHSARGRRRGGGGDAGVVAPDEPAGRDRPRRNARGANGERRLAGGRPRNARSRR
jgi:AcrR family transcriptional regulator